MPLWHLRTVRVQRLPGLPAETSCCPRCALVEADDGNDGDGGGGGALSARLAASQGPRAADATLLTCNWLEVSAICHWQWALRLHACCLQLFSLKIIKLKWPVNWLQQQHRGSRGSGEATEFNCDAQSTVELPPPPALFLAGVTCFRLRSATLQCIELASQSKSRRCQLQLWPQQLQSNSCSAYKSFMAFRHYR